VPNMSLTTLSPLGRTEAQIDEIGAVRIVEKVDTVLASLTQRNGSDRAFKAAAKKLFKSPLPNAGLSVSGKAFTTFWSSPEQWFVEAPADTHEDIANILKGEFGETASITEQSGGWCRFDVEGDDSVSVLERLCAVDTATMQCNAATRSVIEHIGVFVLCRKAGQHFSLYGPRSSADSLHHALVTSAKSIA